jgi:hypothetical protein
MRLCMLLIALLVAPDLARAEEPDRSSHRERPEAPPAEGVAAAAGDRAGIDARIESRTRELDRAIARDLAARVEEVLDRRVAVAAQRAVALLESRSAERARAGAPVAARTAEAQRAHGFAWRTRRDGRMDAPVLRVSAEAPLAVRPSR